MMTMMMMMMSVLPRTIARTLSRTILACFVLALGACNGARTDASIAPPAGPGFAAEQSVRPGINDRWMSADIAPLVETLEGESREIYRNRAALAALVAPPRGADVADVGAGSGFMSEAFARMVGAGGKVYAVDINPVMMQHVAEQARANGLTNIETVVCGERSVDLPRASVDLVFICDTYHHFEYPTSTMRSIHAALRPGGQLVIVDFDRIPGVTRPFLLEHVRAGREMVTREIEASGFELIGAPEAPFLAENYVLRFRRDGV